ncbi:MAG: DNA repair protein RadA [Myxococcaceae bacterium]|nr:DNA repair protein RadA [Myxococcaceae bacterium]
MAKAKTHYTCQACGYQTAKWLGKCPDCGTWSSLVEETAADTTDERRPAWGAAGGASRPVLLQEVTSEAEERRRTGIQELDRVLGGGVVPGSLVLLGGDPGIGKSTLLLAAMDRLSREGPVLYVSGEESLRQTKMRAERLKVESQRIHLFAETDADKVLQAAEALKPSALVVDSIQTTYLPELGSAPGTISQVREVAGRLMAYAKRTGVPTFLVGHVTKEGSIAGPRVLEHMVDTVLYFEGERGHSFRILRAHKNRFGSTNEIGVFEMKALGLMEVPDPSALFLAERPAGKAGSVVTSTLSGTRPLLVEVQALVAPTGYGTARRTAIGVDTNRVALLAAVLEKKEDVPLVGCDLFVNVAGGMQLSEPACDLAVCAALVSSLRNRPLEPHTLVLGEVGLAGEVRAVGQVEPRLSEAAKMGFTRVVLPRSSARRLEERKLEAVGVDTLGEALEVMFS